MSDERERAEYYGALDDEAAYLADLEAQAMAEADQAAQLAQRIEQVAGEHPAHPSGDVDLCQRCFEGLP